MKSTEQPERGTEKLKTKTNTTKLQETEAGSGMPFITFQTVSLTGLDDLGPRDPPIPTF